MSRDSLVRARPEESIAYVEVNKKNEISSFVALGGLTKKEGYNYLEVDAGELEKINKLGAPCHYFKIKNGLVYIPFINKIKYKLEKTRQKVRIWRFQYIHVGRVISNIKLYLSYLFITITSSLSAAYLTNLLLDIQNKKVTSPEFLDLFTPIFVSILTITGLYLTIKESRSNYYRQRENSVRPSFSIENYENIIDVPPYKNLDSNLKCIKV